MESLRSFLLSARHAAETISIHWTLIRRHVFRGEVEKKSHNPCNIDVLLNDLSSAPALGLHNIPAYNTPKPERQMSSCNNKKKSCIFLCNFLSVQ